MTKAETCDHCGEELGKEPVRQGDKVYCCQACAFEASRSKDCSGRADGHVTHTASEDEEEVQG
jgi:hypothetical protein